MSRFVILADIMLDINGGEYSSSVDDVLLGIKDFETYDEAYDFGKKELNLYAENEYEVAAYDSEVKVYTMEEYMDMTTC